VSHQLNKVLNLVIKNVVETDGRVITGQNQLSSAVVAQKIIAKL